MKTRWREISLLEAARARLGQRGARIVPYRGATIRLRGTIDGGGRLDVGHRWPDGNFSPTELIVRQGGRCIVDGEFRLYSGSSVVVERDAALKLGSGFLNNGASIVCFSSITIGHDVLIGPDACILDSDSHVISGASGPPIQPVRIGNHVWIGMRAVILKGVTISDGAIVAAGAIVVDDVEPETLVAGAPARFVRRATWGPGAAP